MKWTISALALAALLWASAAMAADPSDCLSDVAPATGFAFLSDNTPNTHNHPAMYAWGVGDGAHVTVVGKGKKEDYKMKDFDKAIAAYRALLVERGYEPPKAGGR